MFQALPGGLVLNVIYRFFEKFVLLVWPKILIPMVAGHEAVRYAL